MSRAKIKLLYVFILFPGIVFIALFCGGVENSFFLEPFGISRIDRDIFWNFRVPRVLLGILAGGGLSLAGMSFQTLFRNPLASPYTFGVAGGASLGAAIAIFTGGMSWWSPNIGIIALGGLIGGSMATLFLYSFAKGFSRDKTGAMQVTTLLLAGVALSFFFASLLMFLQYISTFVQSFQVLHWLMGGLQVVGYDSIILLIPFVVCGCILICFYFSELDIVLTGEEMAYARGVDVQRLRITIFLGISVMVGAIVSVVGPIGFVGIIVPHFCRLAFGISHRVLAPVCFVAGGVFLVLCDFLSRVVIAPVELPVGIVTAMLGTPFFLYLLSSSPESA